MATRSRIAIELPDGKVKSVYCHSDGYPEYNGKVLHEHYQDREKVLALIELGDLSSLDKMVDPTGPHTFSNPQGGVTVAYRRDRGESGTAAKLHKSSENFFSGDIEEFGYLFTSENEWVYVSYSDRNPRKCSEI